MKSKGTILISRSETNQEINSKEMIEDDEKEHLN